MALKKPIVIGTTTDFERLQGGDKLDIPGGTVLTEDVDLYISTSGNDSTGDGSMGSPFATPQRAAEEYSRYVPGPFTITVNVEAGVYSLSDPFNNVFPYGSNLLWEGEPETIATPTISNIDATPTTGTAPYTGLEFVDFDLELIGANADVGHFIRMVGCTAGTNPDGLNGLHPIVAWDKKNEVATCRVWRRVGTTEVPSGSITVSEAWLIPSVFNFTSDDHAINVAGPFDLGHWNGIVIQGNSSAFSSQKRAVRLFNGATIRAASISGSQFGLYVHDWGTGFEVVGGATSYVLRGGVSKTISSAVLVDSEGTALMRFESVIHGTVGSGLRAFNGTIIADTCVMHSCSGSAAAVFVARGAFADIRNSRIHYDQTGGTAVFADDCGTVLETGATIVGFATDYSPTADTFGNNHSFIATL